MISSRGFAVVLLIFLSQVIDSSHGIHSPVFASGHSTYLYSVQTGTPVAIQSFILPEKGCEWLGVAGQVFSSDGSPVIGLIARVEGDLAGEAIFQTAGTGNSSRLGPSGYSMQIATEPIASTNSLQIQLLGTGGIEVSPPVAFNTYDACDKNLILINFVGVEYVNSIYFPLVISR